MIGSSCSWAGISRDILPSHRHCPHEPPGAVAGSVAQQGCAGRAGGSGWAQRDSCPLRCCGCSSGYSCAGVSAISLVPQHRASGYLRGHWDLSGNGDSLQVLLRRGAEGAQVPGTCAHWVGETIISFSSFCCLGQPVHGCNQRRPVLVYLFGTPCSLAVSLWSQWWPSR